MRSEHARVNIQRLRIAACALCVGLALSGATARAADDEPGQPASPNGSASQPSAPSDFLIGAPRAWFSFRGSQLFPRAGGDLFAFVSDQLTVDRASLRSRGLAADLGIALGSRVDVVTGFDFTRHATPSEYRHFVASNAQPITQSTQLKQTALSIGTRYSPIGRGLSISRFAFIPRRVTPYVGGGATLAYYNFSQLGQFVDAHDLSIFTDRFVSNGWTVGPYVNGGADIQLWKRLYVSFDGRYSWLHSELDSDFSGFDGIDLAGFRASWGFSVVF